MADLMFCGWIAHSTKGRKGKGEGARGSEGFVRAGAVALAEPPTEGFLSVADLVIVADGAVVLFVCDAKEMIMAKTFEDVLTAIRNAGTKGLGFSKIKAKWPGKKAQGLGDLEGKLEAAVRDGSIEGPVSRSGGQVYFAAGMRPAGKAPTTRAPKSSVPRKPSASLESVTSTVSELVSKSGVKLLPESALKKEIETPGKKLFADAVRNAVSQGLIAELIAGGTKYYLHRDVAAERFGFKIENSDPASFGMAELLPIYRRLKTEQSGLPAVKIFDVIRLSGADRAAVHKLLIAEQKSGRVTIHQSNSIDLPREVIDAGIRVEGYAQPYVNVVVKEIP